MKCNIPLVRPNIWRGNCSFKQRLLISKNGKLKERLPKGYELITLDLNVWWFNQAGWLYRVELETWTTNMSKIEHHHASCPLYFFRKGVLRDGCMAACEAVAANLFDEKTGGMLYAHDFTLWTKKERF